MPRRKTGKRRGGGWFGADEKGPGPFGSLSRLNPFASTPTPAPAPAPVPVPAVVAEPVEMAKTAGKRIKRHTGFNPASPGDARKLLKTAKGDKMLGGRRRKTRRRRS
jgi:hypothetical protein